MLDTQLQLAFRHPPEQVAGPPRDLVLRLRIVRQRRAGQEQRALRAEEERRMSGTGPLAFPKLTIMPRGRRQSRLFEEGGRADGVVHHVDPASAHDPLHLGFEREPRSS